MTPEGLHGAGADFAGKENWKAPELSKKIFEQPARPQNLNRTENQKQFTEARKDELIKKFGNVVMAVSLKSERISNALKDIIVAAESSPDGTSILEGLDNEYFSIESLASQSLDTVNENQIVDLLINYKTETDSKARINISKEIEELR